MAFPVFQTDRLLIRPFTLGDLDELHRILDFELKWSGEPLTREDRQEVLEGNIAAYGLDVPCGWRAIVDQEGHPLMGMVRLNVELLTADVRALFLSPGEGGAGPFNTMEYYLGYALSPAYWGHGYATEAARALIQYAFQEMKLPRLLAETSEENTRSQNVMRRLGMRLAPAPRPGWPDRIVGLLENEPAAG
jgi:RimJ/RimL family protein N-acetyltransferase